MTATMNRRARRVKRKIAVSAPKIINQYVCSPVVPFSSFVSWTLIVDD